MLVTMAAVWLIGSQTPARRHIGFWVFLASNALWIAVGLHAHAWTLIILQLCLTAMNLRGAKKADEASG
ncbi:hypothetical protein [Metapseudomonas resinovorans]|uniref:hypothetical protein n=1 Tax=Metapseudomonas resinovorans TaxID=53412 RepID=UPI003B849707